MTINDSIIVKDISIVVRGPERSGKTLIIKLLNDYLKSLGMDSQVFMEYKVLKDFYNNKNIDTDSIRKDLQKITFIEEERN